MDEDQVRAIVERTLTARTIPAFPAYFFQKDWLVTYDWLMAERSSLAGEIRQLHRRIAQLEKPWWRRWRSR